MNYQEFKQAVITYATANNIKDYELYYTKSDETSVEIFQTAVKGELDIPALDEAVIKEFEKENTLKYYNSDIHRAAFALPNYVKKMLNE